MGAREVIKLASEQGVFLFVEEEKLRYKAAPGAMSDELSGLIKNQKQSIIEVLQTSQDELDLAPNLDPLTRLNATEGPLSFSQQRLWLVDSMRGGNANYNLPLALEIAGDFDLSAAEAAIQCVIERHEILRTSYGDDGDSPVQRVQQDVQFQLDYQDLRHSNNLESDTQTLVDDFYAHTFNLREELMLRGTFLHTDNGRGLLLINTHHIAMDGWSVGILMQEFAHIYESIQQNRSPALPPLSIQYLDFATHQQSEENLKAQGKQLDYWKSQLEGAPVAHSLPTKARLPASALSSAKTLQTQLPVDLFAPLDKLAKSHRLTHFMLFHAAFALVIARFSDEQDIVISSSVANRLLPSLEHLIGFFLNTLALRVNTDLKDVESYLRHVRDVNLGAQSHQNVPFEQVLEATEMPRNLPFTPLAQIALTMNTTEVESVSLKGLDIQPYGDIEPTAKSDLRLRARISDNHIGFKWTYDSALFSEQQIVQMNQLLEQVMTRLAQSAPTTPLSELTRLPTPLQEQVLSLSHGKTTEAVGDKTLSERILHNALLDPNATAIECMGATVDYGVLADLVSRLAAYLVEEEVEPGSRVGILLPADTHFVLAALSVMHAGGAYIPLLLDQGHDRLQQILTTAEVELVLTSEDLLSQVPLTGIEVMCIDDAFTNPHWLAEYQNQPVVIERSLQDTAYVIFTSGSTGTPKGVAVSHASLLDYCEFANDTYYQPLDGALLVTNPAFDISLPSLFVPLLNKGVVNLPGDQEPLSFLAERLAQSADFPLLLRMTPLHVEALLELLPPDPIEGQHGFVVGGEAFSTQLASALLQRFPDSQIYNHYGPTETVVGCCLFPLNPHKNALPDPLPIGRPMHNTQLFVLDKEGQLLPPGAPGELCISGVGVAQGYVNQAALTEAKFQSLTIGSIQYRVYRSGDRVRWNESGQLEFLGRLDDQVKIHGFRIEPGEITASLVKLDCLSNAAVLPQQGEDGKKHLIAYLVPSETAAEQGAEQLVTRVKSSLKQALPDYMLPAGYLVLDSLPLTKNGKLNKNALPKGSAPVATRSQLDAPSTPLERYIAQVWETVLPVDAIGRQDNFFDVGGHSLLAIRVINQIQKKLGEIIHLVVLFDHPTLASFCAYLVSQYPQPLTKAGLLESSDQQGDDPLLKLSITDEVLDDFRNLVPATPGLGQTHKRPGKMVFVLSPPRSGSTLLRVMLAGHSQLFAPPELELLQFDTLTARKEAYSGRYKFRLEGTLRTLMEAKAISLEQAQSLMEKLEGSELPIQDFYRQLQSWVAPALLVDKTPYYSYHPDILNHAEAMFDDVHYIHLLRHPHGMISSFEKAQMNQVLHLNEHDYNLRQLGEMVWANSHQNIERFLAKIPQERQHKLCFEHMLAAPEVECRKLCDFLDIQFEHQMLTPYDSSSNRMTDGTQADSRMLGDVKFHQHQSINSQVGDAWKEKLQCDFLSDRVWQMAQDLGYRRNQSDFNPLLLSPIAPRQDKAEPIPLSSAQQRLWFIDQMIDGNTQYNNLVPLRIDGHFDPQAAEQALDSIISRHEILRTRYIQFDSTPMQVVKQHVPFRIQTLDLAELTQEQQNQRVQALIEEEDNKAFNLSEDLMLRVKYARVSADAGYLMFNIHHIASDGWSMSILVSEFVSLYRAIVEGEAHALPPLTIQYGDYAVWQKKWLEQNALENQLSYWQRKLSDAPPVHGLPLDKPRPAVKAHQGDWVSTQLSTSLSRELRALAKAQGVTLFMLLHAALSVVVARHSYRTDIVIGTPNANRRHSDLEPLIGFFINTLVLRTRADFDYFTDLLRHIREVNIEAQDNQDVPFDYLVEQLQVPRSTAHSPVFQIIFNMGNNEKAPMNLPGVEFSHVSGAESFIKFDLQIIAQEQEENININWGFDTSLFHRGTIERLSQHMISLLHNIADNPNGKLSDLPMLNQDEQRQLLELSVSEQAQPAQQKSLIQRLEDHASIYADEVAVIHDGQSIHYATLVERVNQFAQVLQKTVQKADNSQGRIGLLLDKGPDSLISILASLKAGITYVPIDSSNPNQRIHSILEDAKVDLVVTRNRFMDRLAGRSERIVNIDELKLDRTVEVHQGESQFEPINTKQTAYVIYTSGSTGLPKGVEVSHQSLNQFVDVFDEQMDALSPSATSPWLWNASIAFDASLKGVVSLCTGRPLLIPTEEQVKEVGAMVELIKAHQVEVVNALPQVMTFLLTQLEKQAHGVHLIVSGDRVSHELWQRLLAYTEQCQTRALNAYGPTETTVNATFGMVEGDVPNIGRPVTGAQALLLDPHHLPAPMGATGELVIAGHGVAKGYLNQSNQTKQCFVELPDQGDKRFYLSGDLVRYDSEGRLQFIGRRDQQLKIRGYRVEASEIENALLAQPQVGEARVLLQSQDDEQSLVVAYLALGEHIDEEQLSLQVAELLPHYMRPDQYRYVDALPLTPSGKVDIQALKSMASTQEAEETSSPETHEDSVVSRLGAIWCDILSLQSVQPDNDFFRLGGHSLLAMKLLFEIDQAFDVQLDIRDLFGHLTLQAQAELISSRVPEQSEQVQTRSKIPALPDCDEGYPLSYAQQRLWFIDQLQNGSPEYNMFNAFEVSGGFQPELVERAFGHIVSRHDVLRTRYVSELGHARQVVDPATSFELVKINLSKHSEHARRAAMKQLLREESQHRFNLATEKPLRVIFVQLDEAMLRSALLINLHHICSDGWSMGVLTKEFVALYSAFSEGQQPDLAPLEIQYRDYAAWQVEQLSGENKTSLIDYWQGQLAGAPTIHSIPLDKPRPEHKQYAAGQVRTHLPVASLKTLHGIAQASDVSLFMLLHGALSVLIARHGNTDDVVIGTPVANRVVPEVEPLIGFFLNMLALRVKVNDGSFTDFLTQVKAVNLDAQAHQGLPFEMLVDALNLPRTPAHSPLFQIMFTMNTTQAGELALPGLKMDKLSVADSLAAKYDLNISAQQADDGLYLSWVYDQALFTQGHIEQLADSFTCLLQSIVANPQQRVYELKVMSEEQRTLELAMSVGDAQSYPDQQLIHVAFEQQVVAKPNEIALRFEGRSLTYKQLNEAANRLAHSLILQGAGADIPVGICCYRSIEMVIGILAVLKAGSAYLPIDPETPASRSEFMLKEAGASLLLCHAGTQGIAQQQPSVSPLLIESALQSDSSEPLSQNPPLSADQHSGNLAYIIYTSGSTGQPKGVMVEHRALVNRIDWMQHQYPLSHSDRVLQKTPYTFDVSVWEFLWPLTTGATLVVSKPEGHKDPVYLSELIEQERVTTLHFVPSMFHVFLQHPDAKLNESVRQVFCSGEALAREDVLTCHQQAPHVALHNLYGPTEAAIDVSYFDCQQLQSEGSVPIGMPIQNLDLYVLDSQQQLCPQGTVGELYIAGDGLARGYINRPELTQERFPTVSLDGKVRMYKTGDLVRRLKDGNLEYLGRIDHQVKIRGLRIELGEIEQCLMSIRGIKRALCLATESSNPQLRAYVEHEEALPANLSEASDRLKANLKDSLPDYMIPDAIVWLQTWPLTANGKVDRKALPAPETTMDMGILTPPVTRSQEQLQTLWSDLLGVAPSDIGLESDFFELGGHSLLVVQLQSLLKTEYQLSVSIKQLYKRSQLSSQADWMHQQTFAQSKDETGHLMETQLLALNDSNQKICVFMTPPGMGTTMAYRQLAEGLEGIAKCYGLQPPQIYQNRSFATLSQLAQYYVECMRNAQPKGPYKLVGFSLGAGIAFEIATQLAALGEKVDYLALLDAPPFEADTQGLHWSVPIKNALRNYTDLSLAFDWQAYDALPMDERLQRVSRAMLDQGFDLDGLPEDLLVPYLHYFQEMGQLCHGHTHQPTSVDIQLFKSTTPTNGQARSERSEVLDWDKFCLGNIHLHHVCAEHRTLLFSPNVDDLINQLSEQLQGEK